MRIGIFGGTFDPIHNGHLLLAESCREQCRLDPVWFVPANIPPHKQSQQISSDKQRAEMISLAISGHAGFRLNTIELDREGVSFTVDTLAVLASENPGDELFLLMGADSLSDFPTWRSPERICELAIPVVVCRPGYDTPDLEKLAPLMSPERFAVAMSHQVESPWIDLSSSSIRQRVQAGRSIRYRTPRSVEKYIETQGLYCESASAPAGS